MLHTHKVNKNNIIAKVKNSLRNILKIKQIVSEVTIHSTLLYRSPLQNLSMMNKKYLGCKLRKKTNVYFNII